jgi:phosphotriesterase-related protein
MTVTGKLKADDVTMMLPHEHITTDFAGAETVVQPQYRQDDAFRLILPYLNQLKQQGVTVLAECTPNYLGRDVALLAALSKASGLYIVTNTGYYAAVDEKFLPKHFYSETEQQIADRWLLEWKNGIDNTGIRPGFIKLGVGKGPLKATEHKLIRAAALTHLQSGLKIAIHSGDGAAAMEEHELLLAAGVAPEGHIVVHAQNDADGKAQSTLAAKGAWISLDGIKDTENAIPRYVETLQRMKKENLLHRVLISHDDGWGVNKKDDGSIALELFGDQSAQPYSGIFKRLKPELLLKGFTQEDFQLLMKRNPVSAYTIKICRR